MAIYIFMSSPSSVEKNTVSIRSDAVSEKLSHLVKKVFHYVKLNLFFL